MNRVKILHFADIHIGAAESFLGSAAVSRSYERLMTFERIIDIAAQNSVKLIAAAGDIFDSNRVSPELVRAVLAKIASVPDIRVIFAAGNHDPLDAASPLAGEGLPDNLFVLGSRDECITFEDMGVRVYGRSFESAFSTGAERFSIVPPQDEIINLAVLHGDLRSDLGSEYNPVTPGFIHDSNMDYIALGHIHKRSEILKLGKTSFAYPGSPEGLGFDETGEKGVYVGEVFKGGCEMEFIPTARRCFFCEKIDVSDCADSASAAEKIRAVLCEAHGTEYAENLFKLELVGTVKSAACISVPEITERLSSLYYVKLKDMTEPEVNYEELAGEISLKGIFVKNMLEKIKCCDENGAEPLKAALKLGLRAFEGEVSFNDN